eukprot:CAMPEP_0185614442 /NCGR_PEP_ID=MMETSP0436-20130131/31636_1 /TAXON_ID=626734 ORGANISM="Favella taraikaensis, Strain Fe Narragansett Bay" /NCGR_SAMPLE_ID=MMETSP0436 /ASSEMBLY_ACC=CAM_ASM_000390 /LENGTH=35 /DNA_ID= /DNA_START= /DNA_END= /DNA_ORIENTATION=
MTLGVGELVLRQVHAADELHIDQAEILPDRHPRED